MISNKILSTSGLTKQFGGLTAVNNVSLDIEENKIFGLIGPNGAGKTTIFNLITGIIPVTSGNIEFLGEDITHKKPHIISQRGIARTFQNIKLFGNLTVLQNVITVAQANVQYNLVQGFLRTKKCVEAEKNLKEMAYGILKQVGIEQYSDVNANNLSYGIQRRVEIARALALKPKILLLDEPAAGMNEDESLEMVKLIKEISRMFELSVLVIDHHMDMIMDLCSNIAVLNFGQLIASGSPDEIQENDAVIEAYLGVEE